MKILLRTSFYRNHIRKFPWQSAFTGIRYENSPENQPFTGISYENSRENQLLHELSMKIHLDSCIYRNREGTGVSRNIQLVSRYLRELSNENSCVQL